MKFDCKRISITNDRFGCTVSLYDREQDGEAQLEMTFDEIIESVGRYIMIQRTYPEDEFETDYRYIETSDLGIDGELENFQIILYRTKFLMNIDNNTIEIDIDPIDKIYNALKEALKIIANNPGELLIKE